LVISVGACAGGTPSRVPLAQPVASVAVPAISASALASAPLAPALPSEEFASVPVSDRDPQWGARDAPVTIVEFADFQCPFCSRVQPTLRQIRDLYGPRKVRLVWKNNPLPFHANARPVAEAALVVFALKGNDAFWQFHDRAYGNQTLLSDESYGAWASDVGVELTELRSALASKKYSGKIDQDMALAAKIGANGTPAFRINGVTVSGSQPFDRFKEVIDAQLAEAAQAVASGTAAIDVYASLTNKHQSAEAPPPAARQAEENDPSVWKVSIADDDPVRGTKDALVTIVEFSDFQCPFCKRVEATLKQIADTYGSDVRFVWKDNPLPFHPRARPTAALARFAYKQKGNSAFWAVHDQLFASNPKLGDEDLMHVAEQAGVNWSAAKAAIDSKKFDNKIESSIDLATDLQARGTPHFFINGRRLSGAQPFDSFKKLIDEEVSKGKALVAKGVPRAKVYEELMKDAKGPPPPEKKEVPVAGKENPFKGAAGAKVVIQQFSDFQCPFCKRVEPTVDQILQEYGGKVKVVWRNVPLDFHQDAPLAAEAAYEAFVQKGNDGFWKFHGKLFEKQPDIKRPTLEAIAQEQGLDMTKFKNALDNHTHKAEIDKDKAIADKAEIRGTPGFTINGYFVSGAQPFPQFDKLIKLALKEAK